MTATRFLRLAGCLALAGLWGAGHAGAATLQPPVSVPEIDTLSGLAAMAALGGIGALLWERRRRK